MTERAIEFKGYSRGEWCRGTLIKPVWANRISKELGKIEEYPSESVFVIRTEWEDIPEVYRSKHEIREIE